MQLARTIFSDSAIFIEKKTVKICCGQKVNFYQRKQMHQPSAGYLSIMISKPT